MDKIVLTVLIPTVDRVDSFQRTIESVVKQIDGLPVKVVVSDNASEQIGKLNYLRNLHLSNPGITILTRPERLQAVNHFKQIIQGVDSEYLLIVADDDFIGPHFIPEFFQTLKEIEFDVFKPNWMLSYFGIEIRDTKRDFLKVSFFF